MSASKTFKVAKDAAVNPGLFNYSFLDESGVGNGPYYPIHAVVDSTSTLVDPVKQQQFPSQLGRQTMAGSLSVALASDQAAVPVSLSGPLPAFAAPAEVVISDGGTIATATGTPADAAYAGSGNPTIVSLLKGMFAQLGQVILGPGSSKIGAVDIDQTTPGTSNGVVINSMAALPHGTAVIGSVTKRVIIETSQLTVTASSAYVTGHQVGGLITIQNMIDASNNQGAAYLRSLQLTIASLQTAAFTLYLFNQQPTNSTWTDAAAPAIAAADVPFLIGAYKFTSPDSGLGTYSLYTLDNLNKLYTIPNSDNILYGILTVTGTPTFAATTDVSLSVGVEWC